MTDNWEWPFPLWFPDLNLSRLAGPLSPVLSLSALPEQRSDKNLPKMFHVQIPEGSL